jgi:replicative DNA helicase
MNKRPTFDPAIYVHSPADLGSMYVRHYEYILETPGITWGIDIVDKKVIPMRPGDVTVICGRPGHGKTSLMARQAKRTASEIAERGAQIDECVIYVSWEEHAEGLEAYFQSDAQVTHTDYAWGRVDIADVRRKAYKRASFPLWMIGYSAENRIKQTKPLTLDMVFQAIESMVYTYEQSPRPVLLCIDYAQIIPPDFRYQNRYQQVKDAIERTKQLSLQIGCPIIMGAQASREVDTYKYPIPTKRDAQESSGIEQVVDKFFGIWRPWLTMDHYSNFQFGGHTLTVTPELFILAMRKQRKDDGSHYFITHFDMAELSLAELELNSQEPSY